MTYGHGDPEVYASGDPTEKNMYIKTFLLLMFLYSYLPEGIVWIGEIFALALPLTRRMITDHGNWSVSPRNIKKFKFMYCLGNGYSNL